MLKIGNDLDGPNFDFGNNVRLYLDSIGKSYGFKDDAVEPHHWNFYEYWNMTTAEFVQVCNDAADAGWLFTGKAREGAVDAWNKVMQYGEMIVITDRQFGSSPKVSHKATENFLEYNGLYWDQLIFSADKTVVPTDIFIEDKLENYDALTDAGTECWLINYPWNQVEGGDHRDRIDHISQWPDRVAAMYRRKSIFV